METLHAVDLSTPNTTDVAAAIVILQVDPLQPLERLLQLLSMSAETSTGSASPSFLHRA